MDLDEQEPDNLPDSTEPELAGDLTSEVRRSGRWGANAALNVAVRALQAWEGRSALESVGRVTKILEGNPALQAFERISRMMEGNPALTASAQLARVMEGNPALVASEQIAQIMRGTPALTASAQLAKVMDGGLAITAAAQLMKSWDENPALTMAGRMSQALGGSLAFGGGGVLTSQIYRALEGFQGSALLQYLASDAAPDLSKFVAGEEAVALPEKSNSLELPTNAVLEDGIVTALANGGQVDALPKEALSYLREYVKCLVALVKVFLFLVGVAQAVEYLVEKLDGVDKPQEIRRVIKALPDNERNFLSSYRVLTRDRVILRSAPDTNSDDLGRLQIGSLLEVLGASGNWINVSVDVFGEAREGWVYRGFSAPINTGRK